jgi:hypothetical protein
MQNPTSVFASILTLFGADGKTLPVKHISLILAAALLAGCSSTYRKGISQVDEFDAVKVDQMVGNNISGAPFQKVIVCLNARRETRHITALTNVDVRSFTNAAINSITNETITFATNFLVTTMTNLMPALPGQTTAASPTGEAAAAAAATPPTDAPLAAVTNAPPLVQGSTNVTASLAQNNSATAGPTQRGANAQVIRTFNNQITTQTNNLSITLMTNLVVTGETNAIVAFLTNYTVSSVTNMTIEPANVLEHDYFLYSEIVPPADFSLQSSGESLILLVDGVRYGLTSSPSSTAFIARKGYNSTLYRVPPELLVAIANAKEVRVRFKGQGSVIERTMNERSRENFKTFLVRYFSPETDVEPQPAKAGGTATAGVSVSAPASQANLQ